MQVLVNFLGLMGYQIRHLRRDVERTCERTRERTREKATKLNTSTIFSSD